MFRSLLIISCTLGLMWNTCAATRTAGITVPGSAVPPEGGLLRLGAANHLAADEDFLRCLVSDPASGYAWVGASTASGQVIKVAFDGTNTVPRRVASLIILDAGEDSIFTGVIDTNAGYAYFGTDTSTGCVIKVTLGTSNGPPGRVGAVIDPFAGYAWFGTFSDPGHVVKVALGAGNLAPTRVDAFTLDAGENRLTSALMDRAAGVAWFGTCTLPGK